LYNKIPNGDKFLLLCLKDKTCNPEKFAIRANTWLYQRIIKEFPNISSSYELEKKIVPEIAERITIKLFEKGGWHCINGKYKGNNGFDGLCIKKNWLGTIKDVLILETKTGNSQLAKNLCGQQMSHNCVKNILTLLKEKEEVNKNFFLKFFSKNQYKEILNLVEEGHYRRRLVRVEPTKNGLIVKIYKIEDLPDRNTVKINSFQEIEANLSTPKTAMDNFIREIFEEALEKFKENNK